MPHDIPIGLEESLLDPMADDTWTNAASGSLPMLLEIDFHFEMDAMGSNSYDTK